MSSINEVRVLHNGYSFKTEANGKVVYKANCSCTLIKAKDGLNILVDTLTPWDSGKLLNGMYCPLIFIPSFHNRFPAISSAGLSKEEITTVICTHGHSDHTGNNNLFPNLKTLIVGQTVSFRDEYELETDFVKGFQITDDIRVIATPGHTAECSTVVVKNTNLGSCVCLAGDLFEKEEDIGNPSLWIEAGSVNENQQRNNRLLIAEMADYIVPGHGPVFKVTDEMVKILKEQVDYLC